MPSCKQCGHAFSEGAKFCPECGEKTGKICTQCGASLRPEAIFCGECGSKAVSAAIEDTGKIIAIVDTHPSLPLPSKTVNVSNSHNENFPVAKLKERKPEISPAKKETQRNVDKQRDPFDVAHEAFNKEDYATALRQLRPLAKQGNAEAQHLLAAMFHNGLGVKKDESEAFAWGIKAAERGNAEAQYLVADMYFYGKGVEEDEGEAFEWGVKAAKQGNAEAQFLLADMYYQGNGVEADESEAFAWLLKAAKQGNAEAQFLLAYKYYQGNGVGEDKGEAFAWFLMAAKQGVAGAQRSVAVMYFGCGNGMEQDEGEAFEWGVKAAEQGDARAQSLVAQMYFYGISVEEDKCKAFAWFLKVAEQGDTRAQVLVAQMYFYGIGVEEDKCKAFTWFLQAAERGGDIRALRSVASMYRKGIGIEEDESKALGWWRQAATLDNDIGTDFYVHASNGLSGGLEVESVVTVYSNGIGVEVEVDEREAFEWARKIAEQGNADAQVLVATMYFYGNGVEEDEDEAFEWCLKAAEQGNHFAQGLIGQMYCLGKGVEQDQSEGHRWIIKGLKQSQADEQNKLYDSYNVAHETYLNGDYATALGQLSHLAQQNQVDSQFLLGMMFFGGLGVEEDKGEAFAWFLMAAEGGNAGAQYYVAQMYFNGDGVEENEGEAAKWFLNAAELGNSDAQFLLAVMYSEGHTNEVDQNDSEAFSWGIKAAEQGNADAQELVSKMYFHGKGVEQDASEAFSWGIKAAEQGRASAQNFIAKLYFKGIGVEEDKGEAFAWCRKAAEQGDASAQAVLDGFSEAAKNDAGNRHRSNAQNITLQNPEKIRPNSGGTSLKISNKENTISGHLVPAKETQGNKIWETVLNLALSTLANFSAEKINDPVFMRKSLGRAHGLLPFVIRVVVTEDMFFNFCFDRRSFLIDKLHSGNTVLTRSEEKNILPSNDEKPWISPETQVINTVDRYSGKMFADNNFYFFPRLDFEKFNNAFESYIQEALEKNGIYSKEKGFLSLALKATGLTKGALPEALGIPLVMYNETAFGSCKTGFVLTTKFFIVKEMVTKPVIIKLGQIESIELANGFLSSGKILVNGNTLLNCTQGKKESLRNFVEMFEEIISIMDGV